MVAEIHYKLLNGERMICRRRMFAHNTAVVVTIRRDVFLTDLHGQLLRERQLFVAHPGIGYIQWCKQH